MSNGSIQVSGINSVSEKASIAKSASIRCTNLIIEEGVSVGENVILEGDNITLGAHSKIEANTKILSRTIKLGYKATVQGESSFKALTGMAETFITGDFSFIGFKQNAVVSHFKIGDYTTIHNSCFITGYEPCILGHNCWVGQNTILNSSKALTIGNNVGIGTNSQLWTHVIHGELIEGCTMFGEHPLTIEDDVWIVGGAVISPNLTLGKRSVIMVGSVVTANTEPGHCYAGVPARDITSKLNPYQPITLVEKKEMMLKFVEEFDAKTNHVHENNIHFFDRKEEFHSPNFSDAIIILTQGEVTPNGSKNSVFSLETKKYFKTRSLLEEEFMRFNERYRAKFIPINP